MKHRGIDANGWMGRGYDSLPERKFLTRDVKVDTDSEARERENLWQRVNALKHAVTSLVDTVGVTLDEVEETWKEPQAPSSAEYLVIAACHAIEDCRYLIAVVTEAINSLNCVVVKKKGD